MRKKNLFVTSGSLLVLTAMPAFAQGTFQNLNFESANVSGYPRGSSAVPVGSGLPGWTAYYGTQSGGTNPTAFVWYDSVSLGGAMIAVEDSGLVPGGGFTPLQGNYSLYMVGSSAGPATVSAIGQTGEVPVGTLSLQFYGQNIGNLELMFNGQRLSYQTIGSGLNYTIYGADISSYAGQVGQLMFVADSPGGGFLDNILFSASAIPEPGMFALAGLGLMLFGFHRSRRCLRRNLTN